jgi:predicted secreted Zn-dependent protease
VILQRAALFAAALLAVGGPIGTFARPVVTETFDYYDVDGASAQELREDLNRRGPTDGYERRHFDAVTNWRVRWQYTSKRTAAGCEIASASTAVEVRYSFPRLSSDSSTPLDVRRAFARYLERLLVHEKGHAQNAIEIARRIEDGIHGLPAAPTCASLNTVANSLGQSLIKEANQLDIEYDARTDHGRTQGARFPQNDQSAGGGGSGD